MNVHAAKLRDLGKGFEGDSFCRPPTRPAGVPSGPIEAEYKNLFMPQKASSSIVLPIAAATGGTDQPIRSKCAAEWPDDFQMRAYCEDLQKKALAALGGRSMTSTNQVTIRNKCLKDWPADYQMQNYCEEQQLKALAKVGGGE